MYKNKMYLVLGDWSDDGHCVSNKVLVETNKELSEIRQAYKDSCKLTGISFNHNEDYTETNRHWEEERKYAIADQYEDTHLSPEVIETLKKYNCTIIDLDEDIYLDEDMFIKLWFWFVGLSLPDMKINLPKEDDTIPVINGYWNEELNVSFGYGLYE